MGGFTVISLFAITTFSSSDSHCLEDKPMTKEAINVQIFNDPGQLYSADQQCELSYGDGAKYCKDISPEVRTILIDNHQRKTK